jgi:CP family cyanate transporter-like MFS transporter
MIADSALRTPQSLAEAVKAYESVGVDELIFDRPCRRCRRLIGSPTPSSEPAAGASAVSDTPAVIESPAPPRTGRLAALLALVLAAGNLRLAVTSIGPVLAEIRDGLGISAAVAGLLTSVPVICFALVGLLAPRLARRLSPGIVITAV